MDQPCVRHASLLETALTLDRPPVAVRFLDAVPAGVRRFLGEVPST